MLSGSATPNTDPKVSYYPMKYYEEANSVAPPQRRSASCWVDKDENVFIFRGFTSTDVNNQNTESSKTDVWCFRSSSRRWSWIDGNVNYTNYPLSRVPAEQIVSSQPITFILQVEAEICIQVTSRHICIVICRHVFQLSKWTL